MSILHKLSSSQGRNDEILNKMLAKELVEKKDCGGIVEIAENLWNKEKKIRSDCISVMEQIGLIDPQLIAPYVSDLLRLLSNNDNRMVWGAMIVLAMLAEAKSDEIFQNIELIIETTQKGSVITHDNGIRVLAKVASVNEEYSQKIFPLLTNELHSCRPKSVPLFTETIFIAVNAENKKQFNEVLEKRMNDLSPNQQKRVKKILRKVNKISNY